MRNKTIRIATRQSPLALWQANHVREKLLLAFPHTEIELLPMLTTGDRFLKDKLSVIGNKGLFVKELEEALLEKRADVAVHSMKDVPAHLPDGLCLAAICKRDNPFDAFLSVKYESLASLPLGAVVGTTSLRRQAQLLSIRKDLEIKPLRGNVQTRIAKLNAGEYDAIILAAAGLERLGLQTHIRQYFDPTMMLPACAQGALGLECREADTDLLQTLMVLNDELSASCVYAERRVNARLGGNCHVPVAVFAAVEHSSHLRLRAKVATPDGKIIITNQQLGEVKDALVLADLCADALLASGAAALLESSDDQS